MRIRVRDFVDTPVLAGAQAGARTLARLIALRQLSGLNGPVFLDFGGIEVATASFLREFALPFKAFPRSTRSSWHAVIANASPETLEELSIVCTIRSDPMLTCALDDLGKVTGIGMAGLLDSKQREAYEFVVANGNVTAKQLMESTSKASESATSPTAWNNRLSTLVDKGIVAEANIGRQKVYTPVLREHAHGH
jgi:hypothetical protein